MDCLIDNIIKRWYLKKGKKAEVIRRYIKVKYGINIDTPSIQKRIEKLNLKYRLA